MMQNLKGMKCQGLVCSLYNILIHERGDLVFIFWWTLEQCASSAHPGWCGLSGCTLSPKNEIWETRIF